MENSFGIIGGMGPMATELFYKMLIEKTDAPCDQDHMNTIILGHATMPDRTEPSSPEIRNRSAMSAICSFRTAKTLESLGCKAIGVTCNTAHYFIDKISDKVAYLLYILIKETAAKAARPCQRRKGGDPGHRRHYQDRLIPDRPGNRRRRSMRT